MLIVGVQSPTGETHYIAAAFPSACGKTNLAMLIPPESMPGWKVWTVGDDIAWLHLGPDGRLYAINPEAGYFGVVPGTNPNTNRNAYDMIRRDTIFTNVALTADNDPWWEGLETGAPAIDWQGSPYDPKPTARPRIRTRASRSRPSSNPSYSPQADEPARRADLGASSSAAGAASVAPLVYEARDWAHGVLVGASVASETTAAATGKVGVVRRDPMAMKPFCGYNFGDYWAPLARVRQALKQPPKHLPRQLVPPRRAAASSCGRASATTCACCAGSSTAAPAAAARRDADRLPTEAGRHRPEGPRRVAADAERVARGRPRAVAQGNGGHRRVPAEFGSRTPAELKAELRKSARLSAEPRGAACARASAARPGRRRQSSSQRSGPPTASALGAAAEADDALALELRAVAAHEDLFAVVDLHERAVRALVDQHELVRD